MANQGWIKLHRTLLSSPIFKDSQAVHLWLHLLLKANHKDGQCLIGNRLIDVNRGQLLTGRKSLSGETGINESKIRRLLALYENDHKVTIKKTTKYSIISITNYDSYQDSDQQTDNKRPASDQQVTTNKNVKNEKKKPIKKFTPPTVEEVRAYITEKQIDIDPEKFVNHYGAADWFRGKTKISNWKMCVNTWKGNGSTKQTYGSDGI